MEDKDKEKEKKKKKKLWFWFILFLIILADAVAFAGLFIFRTNPPGQIRDIFNPKLDKSATDFTEEQPAPAEQEYITVPGLVPSSVNEKQPNIKLHNPEENTVYFKYTMYKLVEASQKDFASEKELQDFLRENENKDENVLYSADGLTLTSSKYEKVSETDLIPPGKQILWNAREALEKGDYDIRFLLSTFDVETGEPCYGANQEIAVKVE